MNRRTFLTAAAAAPGLLQGQAEDGFTALFDGTTLAGWTVREGPESAFYAHDGAIVIGEGSGFPAWLRSERQYENFDFRGEFYVKGWIDRSEERRVGKECRSRWSPYH